MASPAKMAKYESETLQGYLHCVSAIKVSQRNFKYFNALLQTGRDEFHKVVCFSLEKHRSFIQATKNSTAVRLSNVKRSVRFSDPEGFDIVCNKSTSLEVVNVQFSPRVPPSSSKMTLAQIQQLGPRQSVGVLEAKILALGTSTRIINVKGVDREVKDFHIGDATGHTTLGLWDGQITDVHPLKSYRFTDLSTRERDGNNFLTGSPSTTIIEIDLAVGDFEFGEGEKASKVSGTMTAVQIISKRRCPKCKATQELHGKAVVHRCVGCKFTQKSASYLATFSGTLCLSCDGKEQTLAVSNSAIDVYFKEYDLCGLTNDVEDMEEHFVTVGEFSFFLNENDLIVSIKQRKEAGSSVTQP